jgi:hypothetical protein
MPPGRACRAHIQVEEAVRSSFGPILLFRKHTKRPFGPGPLGSGTSQDPGDSRMA